MEQGNIHALCALKILRSNGLRVGALNSLCIDRSGSFTAQSKGGEIHGRLNPDISALIKSSGLNSQRPFKLYHDSSFSVWLRRSLTSDELKQVICCRFSPHAIRHRFAIDLYKETRDVHRLSSMLGHSSLLATTAYLAGLKNEIGE